MRFLDHCLANEVFGLRELHLIQTDLVAVAFGGEALGRLLADVPALLEEIADLRNRVSLLEDAPLDVCD